ncbi:hypothetical protein RBS60_02435 [Sinomonas sp. ASV486]|uniref:hypothetical protein n=1 Tax=Sinomonas sp. ASV486 TaxID=3051170 RepID=UPI0027DC0D3B|nr:hypothetical protein [Sinomonas sp. ASV486]MDQ4489053.1 hypothetical protein [Sinomonas sp. ASV486]
MLNTPPQVMLGVDVGLIALAEHGHIKLGDRLAGFYALKDPVNDTPGQDLEAGTRLEAYSWGNLDRFERGATFLGKVGRAFYNIAWFLVAPFGFANAAYWARSFRPDPSREGGLRTGDGGGLVRLFSLLMTLFLAAAVAAVAFDLIAVQCFQTITPHNKWQVCNALPTWFDGLRDLTRGQRLAAVSAAPIVVVVLVAALGVVNGVRFRTRPEDAARALPAIRRKRDAETFALGVPAIWVRRTINSPTGLLHIAASVGLVVLLLMGDLWSHGADGGSIAVFFVDAALFVVVAGVVIGWSRSIRPPTDMLAASSRPVWATILLLASLAVYVWSLVVVASSNVDETKPEPFVAAQLAPTAILVALAVLAAAGCVVRAGCNEWLATIVLTVGVATLVAFLAGLFDGSALGLWNIVMVAVTVAAGLFVVISYAVKIHRDETRRQQAWHGAAPGVFMLLGLLVMAFLTSAVPLGVGEWLRGGRIATGRADSDPLFRTLTRVADDGPNTFPPTDIKVPTVYWAFGGLLTIMFIAVAILLTIFAMFRLRRTTIDTPRILSSDRMYAKEINTVRRRNAFMQRAEPLINALAWVIGIGVALSLSVTVMREARDLHVGTRWNDLLAALRTLLGDTFVTTLSISFQWVVLTTVVLGALGLVSAAVANAAVGGRRPLGLLWDVMAWLPRAAHPFGPACYSERAVPELANRIIGWLERADAEPAATSKPDVHTAEAAEDWCEECEDDDGHAPEHGCDPDPNRRLLLSMHSLGAVLGVAALFHVAALGHQELLKNVKMITFGVQLRPYFGRFFPEFFGPKVLGTPGVAAPSFWQVDPWAGKDLDTDGKYLLGTGPVGTPPEQQAVPLRTLVGAQEEAAGAQDVDPSGQQAHARPARPVWINLWRRTDYLGFPVFSYTALPNVLDCRVSELEPDSYMAEVATHGNYLPTAAYSKARSALLKDW